MKQEEKSLRTKLALVAALKEKMNEKPISKITVRELIETCAINRKTFYYHFDDIYALLKWMLERETFDVIKSFDLLINLEDAILFIVQYVEDNKHILNCAVESISRDDLMRFFIADFNDIIYNYIKNEENRLCITVSERYISFLTSVYCEALAGILINYIKLNTPDAKKKETVDYIILFLRSSLPGALTAAAEK